MLDFLAKSPSSARHPATWLFAVTFPRAFRGESLHHLALYALYGQDYALSLALFERAGIAYRREVVVGALARLRVHELIARVRAGERPRQDDGTVHLTATHDWRTAMVLETERRLAKLELIESLEPPFELVDAHELMASWWSEPHEAPEEHEAAGAA